MNKFSFLLAAALSLSLHAQENKPAAPAATPTAPAAAAPAAAAPAAAAPAAAAPAAAKGEQKTYFVEVWNGKSANDCLAFQRNIQLLSQELEELKKLQVFLDNALTTPEREARGHDIAAKQAKLKGDNESMGKLYNGFSIERPFQFIPTKALFAVPLSNEDHAKISAAKDFKPDSVIIAGDKKFLIKDTIAGQVEVETFQISLKRIVDTKAQLQQLIDLQPKLTKDDDKKKVEKAIKEVQDELNKSLEEFKKARGFDYPSENITLPAEAKLAVQITEEEKKAIDAKTSPAKSEPEKK